MNMLSDVTVFNKLYTQTDLNVKSNVLISHRDHFISVLIQVIPQFWKQFPKGRREFEQGRTTEALQESGVSSLCCCQTSNPTAMRQP